MNGWTILYEGVEKTLEEWGVGQVKFFFVNEGVDTATFTQQSVKPDLGPTFFYEKIVTFKHNGVIHFAGRVSKHPAYIMPDNESISYIVSGPDWDLANITYKQPWGWLDYAIPVPNPGESNSAFLARAVADSEMVRVFPSAAVRATEAQGIWDRANTPYNAVTNPLGPVPGGNAGWPQLLMQYTSHVLLGQRVKYDNQYVIGSGNTFSVLYQSLAMMVTDIIQFAASRGANAQVGAEILGATGDGTQGYPDTVPVLREMKDITCANAMERTTEWAPDSVRRWDYSTTPPTLHWAKRNSWTAYQGAVDWDPTTSQWKPSTRPPVTIPGMPEINLSLGSAPLVGTPELTPRYDLQRPSVCLIFECSNTLNGQGYPFNVKFVAPEGKTGDEFGSLTCTIDLKGFSMNTVSGAITAAPMHTGVGAAYPNAQADLWWGSHHPWQVLDIPDTAERRVISFTTKGWQRMVNADGTPSALYPNEMVGGQWAPWMNCHAGKATFGCQAEVVFLDDLDNQNTAFKDITIEVVVTDSPLLNGAKKETVYTAMSSFESGEPIPVTLHNYLYDSFKDLQYEGQIQLESEEITDWLTQYNINGHGLGYVVNILNSANNNYGAIRALVQKVDEDLDNGKVTLHVGPPRHLSVQDLVASLQLNRYRFSWTNPLTRQTASLASGATIQLAKEGNKSAMAGGVPFYNQLWFTIPNTAAGQGFYLDATKTGSPPNPSFGLELDKTTFPAVTPGLPSAGGYPAIYALSQAGLVIDRYGLKDSGGRYHRARLVELGYCWKDSLGVTHDYRIITLGTPPYDPATGIEVNPWPA